MQTGGAGVRVGPGNHDFPVGVAEFEGIAGRTGQVFEIDLSRERRNLSPQQFRRRRRNRQRRHRGGDRDVVDPRGRLPVVRAEAAIGIHATDPQRQRVAGEIRRGPIIRERKAERRIAVHRPRVGKRGRTGDRELGRRKCRAFAGIPQHRPEGGGVVRHGAAPTGFHRYRHRVERIGGHVGQTLAKEVGHRGAVTVLEQRDLFTRRDAAAGRPGVDRVRIAAGFHRRPWRGRVGGIVGGTALKVRIAQRDGERRGDQEAEDGELKQHRSRRSGTTCTGKTQKPVHAAPDLEMGSAAAAKQADQAERA